MQQTAPIPGNTTFVCDGIFTWFVYYKLGGTASELLFASVAKRQRMQGLQTRGTSGPVDRDIMTWMRKLICCVTTLPANDSAKRIQQKENYVFVFAVYDMKRNLFKSAIIFNCMLDNVYFR